ncbi:VOC family protein [Mycobacterium montefiorense]|uniref:Glyoxalase n=1 Tax=Mycobacterium montefiorense TaxID=154654 RepID=A0AA37USV3_9MYCO|nr:VOC family protein [Mycobacterium montefiorense]GBG37340.1 glyoxalase [Mycobacterium montefiorense]GKU37947.1 glyoxalase [Mycobacterium montefiorense]GKU42102.1 glyoxalase [Mycobacterium montefiorense]GKU45972.1 glyoxalase [Mycobacterium montefiorense]GKU52837.1 glyoxalase [Mycobacterium montefiorense]
MTDNRTVFNHVGLCVRDTERSRRFYEEVLGFQYWWELEPPDAMTAQVVQLPEPLGVKATYLVKDGFVLELIDYSKREVHAGATRVMDEVGLTHISMSVSDLAAVLAKVPKFGGSVVEEAVSEMMGIIRDPDGQMIELVTDGWLAALPPRP